MYSFYYGYSTVALWSPIPTIYDLRATDQQQHVHLKQCRAEIVYKLSKMQANWLDLSLCVDLFHHERINFLAEYTGALTYCLKSYCHFLLREVIEPYQLAFPIDLWVPETPTEIEHKDRFQ